MISLFWSFFIFQLFGQPTLPTDSFAPVMELASMNNCNLAISIPQDDCVQGLEFPMPISGLNNIILGDNVELSEARLIINHTWELDLRIYLRSPSGTRIPLSIENGTPSSNNAYGDISISDCAAYTAFTEDPCLDLLTLEDSSLEENFTGKFLPDGDFSDFDGEDPNGIWYLEICDKDAGANLGRLEYADLFFTEIHCDAPENVQVSSVNNASITVTWDPIPNTVLTLIEVLPHGATPSTDSTSANGNIFQTNNISSSTALELQEDTGYDVYVRTQCPNELYSKNSCPVFVQTACETQAVTIQNNFDNQPNCVPTCGASCLIQGLWSNVSYDDFDWLIGQGSITSVQSGPSDDVDGGGKYAYVETNNINCQFNKTAILESNCLQVSANQNNCHMSFYVHSYGSGLGVLELEILPQGSQQWASIWSSMGINDNNWLRQYINLQSYDGQNVKIRFVATGATSNSSNIAIDEISFYGAQPGGTPSFVHYRDRDNDGYGNSAEPLALCSAIPPLGFVTTAGDCDDSNPNISPISAEIGCNSIDENCNGMSDDNMVNAPSTFLQEVCSGESILIEVANTNGYETHWFEDSFGNNSLGEGNPLEINLTSGNKTVYAQNVLRNGPGLRLTEANLVSPYHLEIESIGKADDYSGWKIYVNSVLNGNDINGYNATPWLLGQMDAGEVLTRTRNDWTNPILWPNSRPGWVMLIDQQGTIQDALFWNWSDTEMATLQLNIEGKFYNISNVPWQGSAINAGNCAGTLSLFGSEESNSTIDYKCQLIGTIGDSNPDLSYETVCASGLVSMPVSVKQSPDVDFVLDNDPCDNGSVSSGIELLVDDGVGPFEYFWSNGSTEQNQNNLAPGNYNVTIVGGNGCNTILENITIGTNSATLGVFTEEVQNASCFGSEDGMVVVEVEGGAPPYQFNWIVGVARDDVYSNRDTLQGLAEGQYAVTVTDNNGCVSSTSFEVDQPQQVTINLASQIPSCQSSFDGFISVVAEGGNPPFSYQWNNGRTTSTNSNLSFGTFTVTITDDNDCVLVSDPIIFNPLADTIVLENLNINQVECASQNSGFIETSFTGGVGVLSYLWDNGATTASLYELEAGSYSLTVTDDNQCEYYLQNVTIDQPLNSSIALNFNTTNTSCNGVCDGVLSTSITGGNPPYIYNWSTGDSTATLFDLCEGTVGLTITDAVGCENTFDNEIFISAEGTDLLATNQVDSITCFNSGDGLVQILMSGGSPPYTYHWGHTAEDTPVLTDLQPGDYNCTVFDNQGCIFTPETLTLINPTIISLDSLHIEPSVANAQDGAIEIFLLGGRGDFTITWYDANDEEVGTGFFINNIGIGNYSFIAVDQGGCEYEKRDIVVELSTATAASHHLQTFDLAPNPSSDYIFLDAQFDQALSLDLYIYDASGRIINTQTLGVQQKFRERLDVSDFISGVYFAVLWDAGDFIGRKTFIVD